jgi:hypothetical protein
MSCYGISSVLTSILQRFSVIFYSCLHVGFLWCWSTWHFLNILIPFTCLCYKLNTNWIIWLCRWDWGSCLFYHWCIHHCVACLLNIMRKWNRGQPAGLQDKSVYSRHLTHDQNVAIILVFTVLDSVHFHWSNKCCLLSPFFNVSGTYDFWNKFMFIPNHPFHILYTCDPMITFSMLLWTYNETSWK